MKKTTIYDSIISIFEKYLNDEAVKLSNPDKAYAENTANICGEQYYDFRERISDILADALFFDTDSVRVIIDKYLNGVSVPVDPGFCLNDISIALAHLDARWKEHPQVAPQILSEFRLLLDEAGCGYFQLCDKDRMELIFRINWVLSRRIGNQFTAMQAKVACDLQAGLTVDLKPYLEALEKQVVAVAMLYIDFNPASQRYILISSVNGHIAAEEHKFVTTARSAMEFAVEKAAQDNEGVITQDTWNATVADKDGKVFAHWSICVISTEETCGAVLVQSDGTKGFTAEFCTDLTTARREMRVGIRLASQAAPETLALFRQLAYDGENFHFNEDSAYYYNPAIVDEPLRWMIFPITCTQAQEDLKAGSLLKGGPLQFSQTLWVPDKELTKADAVVRNYSPDADSIPTPKQSTTPFRWFVDFGGGWLMQIIVVYPLSGMDAHAVAALSFNGQTMARSFRYNSVSGKWGLRCNGYLFQVNVKPESQKEGA